MQVMVQLHSPAAFSSKKTFNRIGWWMDLRDALDKRNFLFRESTPRSFGLPARSVVTVLNEASYVTCVLIHIHEAEWQGRLFARRLTSIIHCSCHRCHSSVSVRWHEWQVTGQIYTAQLLFCLWQVPTDTRRAEAVLIVTSWDKMSLSPLLLRLASLDMCCLFGQRV
jgi:hypothetical protein